MGGRLVHSALRSHVDDHQSDNANSLAGKQSKLLLPHVCSAAGFKVVAYYHNEKHRKREDIRYISTPK